MIPAPIALGLTICEHVIVEARTNRPSLINTFNQVRASEFPYTPVRLSTFAVLVGGKDEGEMTFVVTHLQTDEEVYVRLDRIFFPDRFTEIRVMIELTDLTFTQPGKYMFHLLVDDDWVAHRRLRVL